MEQNKLIEQLTSQSLDDLNTEKYLMDQIEKMREKGNVSVNIGKEKYKVKTNNNFAILFYDALDYLILEYKLTSLDIRIILCLLRKAEYGNLLKFTQKSIANELNTKQPNIARSFKKFKECKIIIETEDGEIYLDPQVICKGNLAKQQKRDNHQQLKEESLFENF